MTALPEGEPRGCIPLYPNFMMWLLGSSPRGRAKGLYSIVPEFYDVAVGQLPQRESQGVVFHCPRMAVGQLSQRESQGAAPRYIACWHEKWSVSVSIRSIHCFTATPQKDCGGLFCEHLRRFSALTAAGAIAAAAGFPAAEQVDKGRRKGGAHCQQDDDIQRFHGRKRLLSTG